MLEVEATVVATNQKTHFLITSKTRGLTQQEIDESIERLNQLKPSPFDQERWKALLKRAEREYEEAPLRVRDKLGALLDVFEGALMEGDKEQIEMIAKKVEFFLENGASHVIVTSYVFRDGILDEERLENEGNR